MLENKTRKLMVEAKELMDSCVKQMGVCSLQTMSADDLAVIQKCINLVDSACELSIEQAAMMDELNTKLDKVLDILEKAEKGS